MPVGNYVIPPLGKQFYDYNPHTTRVFGPARKPYLYGVKPYDQQPSRPGNWKELSKTEPKMSRSKTKVMTRRKKKSGRGGRLRPRVPRPLTARSKVISCLASKYVNLSGTGTLIPLYLQLNSCDDPFTGGGTGQPLGYDQWKSLYKRAIVLGSKVDVRFHNRGTVAVMCGTYPVPLNQGASALSSYEYYAEVPGAKMRLLSPEMDHIRMFQSRGTKKHLQVTNVKDNAELSIDLVNETAPTKLAYWNVFAQAVDQTSAYAVDAVVTIRYIVLLLDPIIPARSVET